MLAVFVAAILVSESEGMFSYSQLPIRRTESCNICYGSEDCFPLDHLMCEYYKETSHLLKDDDEAGEENEEMKVQVDRIMFGVVELAGKSPDQECLPLLSSYTNCNKENICTGCKKCSCDHLGKWNCTQFICTSEDAEIDVNHRVLVMVLDNLMNKTTNRMKRSVVKNYILNATDASNETSEEILALLYGFKTTKEDVVPTTVVSTKNPNNVDRYFTASKWNTTNVIPETEYIAFDEVLNNLSVETKNSTRRKSSLNLEQNVAPVLDYMNIDDGKDNNFDNMLLEEPSNATEATFEETTKIIIDLLDNDSLNELNFNDTDYPDIDKIYINNNNLDFVNNTVNSITVNITKRDTKAVLNVTEATSNNITENTTYTADDVQNNILTPLNNIINDKQKEIDELLQIRENLITFVKKYHSDDFEIDYVPDIPNNNTKTHLSIYKIEIEPQFKFEYDLRSNNPNVLNKYTYKLKRDIYEVLKDIVGIQKYSDPNKMPDDLKMLIRAMKIYIKNNGKFNDKLENVQKKFRRHSSDILDINPKSVLDGIMDIIKIVDKDMPLSNALAPLSLKSRKVIKRIIMSHFVDEFSESNLQVADPNYKLSNYLAIIGDNWHKLTDNVEKCAVFDRLHAMKLLHYQSVMDISKINNALRILDFTYIRRTAPINELVAERIVEKLSQGLRTVNDKITLIIKLHEQKKVAENIIKRNKKKAKKESFFKRLKTVLRNSKRDITKLLKRKVPKDEIVQQIANKKLDDLRNEKIVDYEDTMRKWQENLNIIPTREKRSNRLQRIKNRMKNILPKYLRGKVNPAIDAKKVNKSKAKHKYLMISTKKHVASTTPITTIKMKTKTRRH